MSAERILVVDDERGMLRSVERVLSTYYRVETAGSPGEALEKVGDFEPDLAIVDIRMPEMDGFELVGKLREHYGYLSVIFMTGIIHELDAQVIRAVREKAFYCIQKPFDREVLLTLVERCLELRRLSRENEAYVTRLEDELQEARAFQRSLLPEERATVEGVSIAARYRACEALSGDFFDYVAAGPGRATVLMADVSGHGVSAAMLVGVVKSAFHDAHVEGYEPLAIVNRIASGIRSFDLDRFVTVFWPRISSAESTLEYVNAGHPAPWLWGAERERSPLELTGPMISPAFPSVEWEQRRIELVDDDRLLVYTDGITEARGEDGCYGVDRLLRLLDGTTRQGPPLLDEILESVRDFGGGRPEADDQTLITVSVG